jgi:hypothetical protein
MGCNTCFVTGSGFSVPAGVPAQSGLLKYLAEDTESRKIIAAVFNLKETAGKDILAGLQLEDIFTFLDKIIAAKGSAGIPSSDNDTSPTGIKEAHDYKNILIECLIVRIGEKLKELRARHRYEHFFNGIVQRKTEHNETNTVVTTNWDTVPDFYINKAFKDLGVKKGGVDYCVYDRDCDTVDDEAYGYTPSILRKAKGWSTVKLLKLHGSMNWALSKEDGALYVKLQTGACPERLPIEGGLQKWFDRIFMTPTFIKDFSNLHTQTIWNNAGFDLAEAKRVVFIGCALQTADYEFRNLLLRTAARRRGKKIRVILRPAETPEEKLIQKQTKEHYATLFPCHDIEFEEIDAADFLLDDGLVWRW